MKQDIRNEHGALSWGELMTTDPVAAKAFYMKVFGWEAIDMPIANREGETYTFFKIKNGKDVVGMMKIPPEMPEGVPPMWCAYITVDSIEETVKNAEEAGGKLCWPVTEIPEVGKFCSIADPQGAFINAIEYEKRF